MPLFADRKAYAYIQTEYREARARVSPDGRWLAYESDRSKRSEIYVDSFPQLGGHWEISTNGGTNPVWSRDGRELYYYSLDSKIMAEDVRPGAQFQYGVAKPLFAVRLAKDNISFDVSKDGRFLLPVVPEQEGSTPMTVVLNWPELLKKN